MNMSYEISKCNEKEVGLPNGYKSYLRNYLKVIQIMVSYFLNVIEVICSI